MKVPIFLFLCCVPPLSEIRGTTNPRCPPCRWSRLAQEEPSAVSVGLTVAQQDIQMSPWAFCDHILQAAVVGLPQLGAVVGFT